LNKTCIIIKVSGPTTCLFGWVALLIWLRLCGTIGESCWICKNNILQFKMRSSCKEDSFCLQKPNMTNVFLFMLFLPFLEIDAYFFLSWQLRNVKWSCFTKLDQLMANNNSNSLVDFSPMTILPWQVQYFTID
jgi:hypothetical protein